jgi:hypothetical protein
MYDADGKILGVSYGPSPLTWVKTTPTEHKLELDHQIIEFNYPGLTHDLDDERIWALLDEIAETHAVDVKADPPRIIQSVQR